MRAGDLAHSEHPVSCRGTLTPRYAVPHERPGRRQRRAGTRPGLEAGAVPAGRARSSAPRATPAPRRDGDERPDRPRPSSTSSPGSARRRRSGSSSSARKTPSPWACPTTCGSKGLRVFGPSKEAARVESSKVFAKDLMRHADVPTAEFRIFDHPEPARTYVETRDYPVVVKADGLAAGKGVIVCKDPPEAAEGHRPDHGEGGVRPRRPAGRSWSRSGWRGRSCRSSRLVSGRTILPLPPCQDHKAVVRRRQGAEHRRHGGVLPGPGRHPGAARRRPKPTCSCRPSTP